MRVDGVGSLFHDGGPFYESRYDRCGHTTVVEAARRELEHIVKTALRGLPAVRSTSQVECAGCALFRRAISPVGVHQVRAPLAGLGIGQQLA